MFTCLITGIINKNGGEYIAAQMDIYPITGFASNFLFGLC
jgi:hypothetical protein